MGISRIQLVEQIDSLSFCGCKGNQNENVSLLVEKILRNTSKGGLDLLATFPGLLFPRSATLGSSKDFDCSTSLRRDLKKP